MILLTYNVKKTGRKKENNVILYNVCRSRT